MVRRRQQFRSGVVTPSFNLSSSAYNEDYEEHLQDDDYVDFDEAV